jgi:hypothetical protein
LSRCCESDRFLSRFWLSSPSLFGSLLTRAELPRSPTCPPGPFGAVRALVGRAVAFLVTGKVTLAINPGKGRKWSGEMRSHNRNHRPDETRTVRPARRASRFQPADSVLPRRATATGNRRRSREPDARSGPSFLVASVRSVCNCIVRIRLSIQDRIYGPEPPTPADLKREVDHERLVRALPVAGNAIEPPSYHTGQNRGGV